MEIKLLAQELSKRTRDVCYLLFPNGSEEGNEFKVGDLKGSKGNSLSINLSGNKAGVWTDFASDTKGGDLIELWRQVKGQSLPKTLGEVHKFLGIDPDHNIHYNEKIYEKPKLGGEITREESVVFKYLTEERLLTKKTLDSYHIREMKKDLNFIIFPYEREGEIIFIKYIAVERPKGTKVIKASKGAEPCLFGWDQIPENAREITITEGEINAMTLAQEGRPALATPFGGGGGNKHAWIENDYNRLDRFETIFIRGDNDPAGKKMVDDLVKRLGRHRCRILHLPKDPNDCLKEGVDLTEFYDNAPYLDPVELKRPSEFLDEVIESFYPTEKTVIGFAPKFKGLYDQEMGDFRLRFRPGEYTVWTGYNFEGKSQMIKQMQLDSMLQDEKVLCVDFENPTTVTMNRLVRSTVGLGRPPENLIEDSLAFLEDRFWLADWETEATLEEILDTFAYATKRFGITQFFIDSLMRISDVPEDDIEKQKQAVNKLIHFVKTYDTHIHLVAHLRKPPSGDKIKDRIPSRFDISGSSKISDLAFNVIIIIRNRFKEAVLNGEEEPEQGRDIQWYKEVDPDALFVCDKQRNGTNWIGRLKLWWDQDSMQYLDKHDSHTTNYIDRYAKYN